VTRKINLALSERKSIICSEIRPQIVGRRGTSTASQGRFFPRDDMKWRG
jgi:hypothetical protein